MIAVGTVAAQKCEMAGGQTWIISVAACATSPMSSAIEVTMLRHVDKKSRSLTFLQ